MTGKLSFLLLFLTLSGSVLLAEPPPNLFANPEFVSKDGRLPDRWSGAGREAYRTSDGAVRISGKTSSYASYLNQTVEIEEGKSYYFSVEMKSDRLTYLASIWYMILDGNGRRLTESVPLLRHYTGPQKDWVRIGFVIPSGHLPGARKLSLSMTVYNPSKRPGEDKAIWFRHPVLTPFTGQASVPPPVPAPPAADEVMPDNPFPDNFTNFPQGTPYKLEKGGIGFLRLNSGTMPRREVTLHLEAPEGVDAELYMWDPGVKRCVRVPAENGRFRIGSGYRWLIWGNGLIFRADGRVPDRFELGLSFTCGGKTIRFAVPVEQIPQAGTAHLPETMRFNSWQSFPVTRIDLADPENRLAAALNGYWTGAGWVHTPFVEIVSTIPYEWKENALPGCRRGITPSGTPSPLFCDSSLIATGPDYFCSVMEKKGLAWRIAGAKYVMWDYEPYVKGPVSASCFCPECRKKFSELYQLPENLSAEAILRDHKSQWTQFRCRQRADVVRTVVAAIKKINPAVKFQLCTMPMAPRDEDAYLTEYGIRHDLYEDFVDIFASMNYWDNLDFYRSLEREMLELKKEKRTLLSNGWNPPKNGSKTAMNLLAAAFCGQMYPSFFQGLFLSNGEQVREIRRVMELIAATEARWRKGTLVRNTRKIREGFSASGNFYVFERKAEDGRRWSLIFNNSPQETLFLGAACDPGASGVTELASGNVLPVRNGEVTLKLPPLSWLLLEFSPERKESAPDLPDWAEEERNARSAYEKMTSSFEKNSMRGSVTPETCVMETPSQTLTLNLKNSGEASWKTSGGAEASVLGRDIFMDKGVFSLGGRTAKIEEILPEEDGLRIHFSYEIADPPYAGLVVRREYFLHRNEPVVRCRIEIVPQGGYRPFRLRTVANFLLPGDPNREGPVSEVTVGPVIDRGLSHASFVREGAVFPDGKPFFSGKYIREFQPLRDDLYRLHPVGTDYCFELTAHNVDQLFVWRERRSATMEFIWPDAYPDNDPHKAAVWTAEYVLKLQKQ